VIPLRDDTERVRAPILALIVAVAAAIGALAALVTGAGGWTALLLAVNAAALWIFGAGVDGGAGAGRLWLLIAVTFGAAGGAALALAGETDERAATVAAAATTVAAFEVIAAHLIWRRGARILSLVLVPWFGGFAAVPAAAWGLIWGALVVLLIALGALGG